MTDQELEGLLAIEKQYDVRINAESDPERAAVLERGRELFTDAINQELYGRQQGEVDFPCEECGKTGIWHHESCINSADSDPLNQIR